MPATAAFSYGQRSKRADLSELLLRKYRWRKKGRKAVDNAAETIYLSSMAECRERMGIEKILQAGGIGAGLLAKCMDKREKALVSDFLALWEERKPYKKYPKQKQDVESPYEGLDTRYV